ncbi:homocysteine S-methyltransferase family protein [Vagococcus intermedius]|uniref:Homocysteine S-methyltransferase family protein n=1 Tax=Vagococcus intermedius TaxID=2991418 RepID=A0AAF0CTQ0_9ENTE|nr:homocysteine S-methyltransferase family protein [Vagococcus intermedius]WEG72790.1 homocysteine S-methyltransferase family protein [Vagococcus intermedius]WEG74875.1 homocysteine S-methyltransferase family protein [Vagococcus intermedius]
MMGLMAKLYDKQVFFDGGIGTELQKYGFQDYPLDQACLTAKDLVRKVHHSYVEAGATMLTTNTFRVTACKSEDEVRQIVKNAVSLAKEQNSEFVQLSVGPGDFRELTRDNEEWLTARYRLQGELACRYHVSAIILETFSSLAELELAIKAIRSVCHCPVFISCPLTEEGATYGGDNLVDFIKLAEGHRVQALGINCAEMSADLVSLVSKLRLITELPLIIQANKGVPDKKAHYPCQDDDYLKYGLALHQLGVEGLGGCCGTTPDLMKQLYLKLT